MDLLGEEELRALIADLESDRIDRTVSSKKTERTTNKICRAICAFANDLPGHRLPGFFLIGVDDSGRPTGLTVTDELLLWLGGLRSNGRIQPIPAMSVGKVSLPEGDVAVVKVWPSDMPPVRFDGRVHIRVGPRRAIASEQEERLLIERRVSRARTFDLEPCTGATLEDIVPELFVTSYRLRAVAPEVIEENNRSLEQQLAALRFFDVSRGTPTHAGILLFGKDPRAWLPGAYVQFLRIDGTDLAEDVVAEQEVSGDLSSVLKELDLITRCVEIQSPGGLYGEATPENFPDRNDYRNPVIADAMKVLGYVNKYGRGVIRAQAELRANGNPEAEFRFDSSFVGVTVRAAS